MWLQIFFSILTLHFCGAIRAEQTSLQYLLAVPSVLQSDSSNTACVHLLNLNESVDLNIFLEYGGQNITVLTERVGRGNFFKCSNFDVPNANFNPLAFITISFKGNTINATERRVVAIQNRECAVFVQTDKPIYKPGQTVLFRVVGINAYFRPCPETYPLITIQDPQSNRIFQWTNVTSQNAITQHSFSLIPEPMLGNYQITVQRQSGTKMSHSFSVDEYVLPKFESTISAPKTVSVENPDFLVKVCSMYTYGQPVEGKAELSVCRNLNFYGSCSWKPLCESVNLELGKDGCLSHVFSSRTFELNRSGYWMNLDVKAIVTEKGTGIQSESSAYISITRVLATVTFQNMEQNYKRGIPYCGELKLVDVDDTPIVEETVQLFLNGKNVGNYSTGASGTAQFCIDTSEILSPTLSLRLLYKSNENCNSDGWLLPSYPEAYYSVQRFYSRTNSFVKIQQVYEELLCGSTRSIKVRYSLNIKGHRSATFYYFLLAKNKIVQSGKYIVNLSRDPSAVSKGSFSIQFTVHPDMAPGVTMLIYTLHPENEVVADTARFQIEKCFKNKVSLRFSEKQGLPGSNISLHIEAAANSYCALRAVDQSVLLLRHERELSAESVYGLFLYEMFGYYFNGLNLEDDPKEPCIPPENIFYNGLFYVPAQVNYGLDIYELIRNTGVKFVTNSRMRQPVVCSSDRTHIFRPSLSSRESDVTTTVSESAPPPPSDPSRNKDVIETVRKSFPETWIWDMVPINSTGHAQLQYIIPDTITEWKTSAFCMEREIGFGISGTASLTAFQSFFVDLSLPYSIIRGEDCLLRAIVFNYLNTCIEVIVSLNQSRDFQANLISPLDDNGCVCGSERKTYIWSIAAKKIGDITFSVTAEALQDSTACGNETSGGLEVGRKDTLIKTLLVEPEGIEKEVTQSSFICTEGATVSEPVVLALPENLVDGSARAYFSCIGDLMGTATQNLHQLLQMPFGCGEQNMALFAPDVHILEYLNATGQLTEEIKNKAIGYLISGYQTQLTFKHPDGSYSAFGSRDKEGNTWLTAFVYKTLAKCSSHIFIDSNVQTQSLIWLSSKQKSNGCFQNVGKLFNNALKGGVQDELSLSAYITAALLESGFTASHPVVRNALYCLESGLELPNITVYDQALLAYAFGLAGNKLRQDFLLDSLIKSAKKEGGTLHWEREDKPAVELPSSFYPRASSAEIEIASYAVLAFLIKSSLTSEEITIVAQIIRWLTMHQNAYGGFSSTQDTVVAIQALAQFSELTFSKDGKNSVKIHSTKPFEKIFTVENSNRLLLHQTSLPDVPGDYTLDVNGKGCVFVQTTLRYNRILPQQSSGFSLSVKTTNESCTSNFQIKFTLVIEASYTGNRNVSNMVIVDVKMLTGFIADRSSLKKLQDQEGVMRAESKENHVICYLDSLSNKGISLSFIIVQDLLVSNLKPASIYIYDYYEQDEHGYNEYHFPCNADSP